MIPFLSTPYGELSTFIIMIALGILSFYAILHTILIKSSNGIEKENFIFPKTAYSFLGGFLFAGVFDSCFKIVENQSFVISGVTFYGGLLGGIVVLYFQLLFFNLKKSEILEWFDILTIPFIVFHFFGRIGCFFAGCCYGKVTNSQFGMYFPDNPAANIFHNGQKCYPTQLFEVAAIIIIFAFVFRSRKKFQTYMIMYALARFGIEFFRGDNRGMFIGIFSPAQVIAILIFCIAFVLRLYKRKGSIV